MLSNMSMNIVKNESFIEMHLRLNDHFGSVLYSSIFTFPLTGRLLWNRIIFIEWSFHAKYRPSMEITAKYPG